MTTTTFSPSARLLCVFGDNVDDVITISRNAAGQIVCDNKVYDVRSIRLLGNKKMMVSRSR